MKLPASKLWRLSTFAWLALGVILGILWWSRVNRSDTPSPVVISKPNRLSRFAEILTSNPVMSIRVDYALLSVVRPPLKPVPPPGVTEAAADLRLYSWDDPVFDEIQGRLTKVEEGDEAAWKRSLKVFQGKFQGLNIEVVSAGSVGNTNLGGRLMKPLHIKIQPKSGDPLEAGYEGHFLIAPSREDRLVGFRNASATSVANGASEFWIPMDIANGELEVVKLFETMTTYSIVVLRFSAVAKSGGVGSMISSGGRGKPVEDKATLIKLMVEGRKREKALARQPPPKPALPKLQ